LDAETMRGMLEGVQSGAVTPDAVLSAMRDLPFEELGFAKVDHHRALRQGFPEVIYCPGKTDAQIAAIARSLQEKGSTLLATRATPENFHAVRELVPAAEYHAVARIIRASGTHTLRLPGRVGIVCAGTGDIPVAEEAAISLEVMGASVDRVFDVGVAGLHRLLFFLERLRACDVLIAVAGMEGALPSVLAGLVDAPVVAVPTSIGYGANLGGLASLLGMLNSCANGLAVVNIDNGFGAAAFAAAILRARPEFSEDTSLPAT